MKEVTLLEMLQHGVHFGHQQSRRHPKMEPAIYATRNGISIINLEHTRTALGRAGAYVRDLAARGGTIVFIGTKKQARSIVQDAAQRAAMPYVVDRWIGGLFTNFSNVRQLIEKLRQLKEDRANNVWNKYTKKEQLDLQNELERLERLVGGLGQMQTLPAAMVVVDLKTDKTAVAEGKKMKIPIVAMCDTNVNPVGIAYPIPANDDATKSIAYITNYLVEAILEGQQQHEQHLREIAQAASAAEAAALPSQEMPS